MKNDNKYISIRDLFKSTKPTKSLIQIQKEKFLKKSLCTGDQVLEDMAWQNFKQKERKEHLELFSV